MYWQSNNTQGWIENSKPFKEVWKNFLHFIEMNFNGNITLVACQVKVIQNCQSGTADRLDSIANGLGIEQNGSSHDAVEDVDVPGTLTLCLSCVSSSEQ